MSFVTINFQDTALTSSNCSILVTSGEIVPGVSEGLSISGTVSFNSLFITSGAITFNVESGTSFNAAVQVPVSAQQEPVLEVTNFSGMVTLMWPTASGPQTQTLESGNPLTLSGFVS